MKKFGAASDPNPSILQQWLRPVELPLFRSEYWGRAALARAGTARGAECNWFDWQYLERVLAAPGADTVIVRSGSALSWAPPKNLQELKAHFLQGAGLTIRGAERCSDRLARLGESVAQALAPAQARTHLFVTPADSHGFSWHFDDEHVFIIQVRGSKDYYFRSNTVCPHLPASADAFRSYENERSPLLAARLIAGDFLYIPARWWHMAVCIEDALSISIGVTLHDNSQSKRH